MTSARVVGAMPKLQAIDRRAVARAAKGLAPMMRRRGWAFAPVATTERGLRTLITELLAAVEDDDVPEPHEDTLVWARVERSGLVLVGIADRAYIVARVASRGGRAARLLVR